MSRKMTLSVAAACGLALLAGGLSLSRRPATPSVDEPGTLAPVEPAATPRPQAEPIPAPPPAAGRTRPAPPATVRSSGQTLVAPAVGAAEGEVAASARPAAPWAETSPLKDRAGLAARHDAARVLGSREAKGEGLLPLEPRADIDRGRFNTEAYAHVRENPFLAVAANPLSTFSIDVDTASYANVRRFLNSAQLPPKDAVRIEELINYFRYAYPEPPAGSPFSITTEIATCPWAPDHRLALVGLRGRSLDLESLPPRNLTFLLDVSGSMNSPDKLPLLKRAMGLLVETLREEDRVAIVVYAGAAGLVLPPTSGADRAEIVAALDALHAGGSTAGGAGIELAYHVAAESFVEKGINRVVLATDGDFNVGVSSEGELVRLIEEKRKTGVFLSVLGFGQGNLQDSRMEKLADHGNGNYSYIDSIGEARKVLVSEAGGTLVTIAKDVKIQVEFNPARVAAYRLIGYENRALRAEDFADDRKDAGEIGASHTVTALYELVPQGVAIDLPTVDPLKYQKPAAVTDAAHDAELLTVKLRHKDPQGERSRLQTVAVRDGGADAPASLDLRFASAVAAFGMMLRDSEHKGQASWAQVHDLARDSLGDDTGGYRAEFLRLVRQAEELSRGEQLAIAR